MKVRNSRCFSANFRRKIGKLDFLELFFDRKIRGLGPRGCGLRRPEQPWTRSHCHVPKLIGARPPADPVAREHGGPGSGLTKARKVMERWHICDEGGGGESSSVGRSGLENGGKEVRGRSVGRRGCRDALGSYGLRGGWASAGNGRPWWCAIMVVEAAVSGGDQPGWLWGVMRGDAPVVTGAEGAPGSSARVHARRQWWLWLLVWGGR
jgi:hypothetical protein